MTSFIRPPLDITPENEDALEPKMDPNVPVTDELGDPALFPAAPPTPSTMGVGMGLGPFVVLRGAGLAEELPSVSGRRAHPDISEPGCG